MHGTDFPDADTSPRPPAPEIDAQSNPVLKRAYATLRASSAPRFMLHLFLPYADNQYSVIVDTDPMGPPDDGLPRIGELVIDRSDEFGPEAVITFTYAPESTCIVAAYADGTITVDFRDSDTIPSIHDSDHVIYHDQWDHAGLLADALDEIGFMPDPARRGQPQTHIRYAPGCEPVQP